MAEMAAHPISASLGLTYSAPVRLASSPGHQGVGGGGGGGGISPLPPRNNFVEVDCL